MKIQFSKEINQSSSAIDELFHLGPTPYPTDLLKSWWTGAYNGYHKRQVHGKCVLYWKLGTDPHNRINWLATYDRDTNILRVYEEGKLVGDLDKFYQKIKTLVAFT